MRVFIGDALPASSLQALGEKGHTVTEAPLEPGALRESAAQVLVVRGTRVDRELLDASATMELIVRAGAGYDSIDVAGAAERGIFVANCPGKNAHAVAELTFGHIIALDRRIPDNVRSARLGLWKKAKYARAAGLMGRTLGIVGLGYIGMAVLGIAKGMGMHVVAWSRSLTEARAQAFGITRAATPEQVAARADIVTLHVASTQDTSLLAGPGFFAAMRPGATFINTSRASIVDEKALLEAIQRKHIKVGLDVLEGEPRVADGQLANTLATHPNVYVTHHIGASTRQAQEATAAKAVDIIDTYARTRHVGCCVNLAYKSDATHLLTVRHLDRPGVLAGVLDAVRQAGSNVQEMENVLLAGKSGAGCARIRLVHVQPETILASVRAVHHVLAASIIRL